jgi:hypothetical protein
MSGFIGFLVFLALIVVAGYFKAKKEANSTPLKRSLKRAASLWNQADPKHRAMMLASIGILEHSPSFAVYLNSTWAQLDFNMCALLGATIDVIRESPTVLKEPTLPLKVDAPSTEWNPALDELRQFPQTAITAGLIAAAPGLAKELFSEAEKAAKALGMPDPSFADCIFDLKLVGAFDRAVDFTKDYNLASLFVDAMVFKATGKSPSEPTPSDMVAGLTHKFRGVRKYVIARKYFPVNDPGALLFGQEYASAKGDGLNQDDVDRGILAALYTRQSGAWATETALSGKVPTTTEFEEFEKAIATMGGANPAPSAKDK